MALCILAALSELRRLKKKEYMKLRENSCAGENKGGDEGEKSEWDGVGLMIYIVKT